MIELRVLGPTSLKRSDGSSVVSLLAQPKRLALAVYLAAPPPHGGRCFHRKDTLVQKIKEIRNHLKNIAETSDLTTLCVDMEFPSFGQLTRYEWLRFILFHTQRHTRQIVNIGKHLANA